MISHFGLRQIFILLLFINGSNLQEEIIEVIDLSLNDLESVRPSEFSNRPMLTTIYLHSNKIQKLPKNLFKTNQKLKVIELQKNLLRNLPKYIFENNREIIDLKLQDNLLGDPWPALENLTKLEYLNLEDNPVKIINCKVLKNLKKLQTLHLDFRDNIDNLCLSENTFLRDLLLKNDDIEELTENVFWNNKNLESISIVGNSLKIIPDGLLRHLKKLNSLQMECKLANPWSVLSECNSLEIVILDRTPLDQITSEQIESLPNLEFLMARNCNVQMIRFDRTHSRLEELNLSNNNLSDLFTESFSGLNNLKKLILTSNVNIKKLAKHQFVNLEHLENLYLNYLSLTSIERENFSGLKNLIFLDLSSNKLTELNADVFHELPPSFRYIYLNGNQLTVLQDKVFFPFKRLILLLYDNQLKTFNPRAFSRDTIIPFLDLDRNPLMCTCAMYESVFWVRKHVYKSRGYCYPRSESEEDPHWTDVVGNLTNCKTEIIHMNG